MQRIYEKHAEVCQTLSSPKRLEIIDILRNGEMSVGKLADATGLSQPNVSQHIAVMRQKGIVELRKDGTTTFYYLSNPKILKAFDILREILFEQLAKEEEAAKDIMSAAKTMGEK